MPCFGTPSWEKLPFDSLWPPSGILSLHIYNMLTVSTISRPRLLVVHSVHALSVHAYRHMYVHICRTPPPPPFQVM